MSDFKNLSVWQKSFNLAIKIYKVTGKFPSSELFGLTSQLRRASVSISTNIAEGNGRIYSQEYVKFLSIARGSAMEVENLLMLSKELGYLEETIYEELLNQCKLITNMLYKLMKSIKQRNLNSNFLKETNETYKE